MKVKDLLEARSFPIDNGPGKVKQVPKIQYGNRRHTIADVKLTPGQKAEVKVKPQVVKEPKVRAPQVQKPDALNKEDYAAIGQKVEQVVGGVFPDGDPNDTIFPWVMKAIGLSNPDKVRKILDKAVKTLGKYKDYDHYLAKSWDDYADSYPDQDVKARGNPWK